MKILIAFCLALIPGLAVAASLVTISGANGNRATVDTPGNLNINCQVGCSPGSNSSVGATGSTIPSQATYIGVLNSGNLKGLAGETDGSLDVHINGTPAVTNAALTSVVTTNGSASPGSSVQVGAKGSGVIAPIIQGDATVPISLASATTTQLIAVSGSTKIYVTHYHFIAAAAVNVTLVYGTGSNCGTGTTTLDGPIPIGSNGGGLVAGAGLGPVDIVPAGKALCVTTSTSASVGGSLTAAQF
jgi:hypothetical protein